ncbi:hypothetical protein ZHAS_00018694 [Anopheles sinensis]|uniref:Uncharacterized protein n=1 Tax=Anopheles sinensis TaxID=74873 RepID=A0A084WKB5_ANOSI|nr:hypothetical protein ZHAS_00018694 [Anopheles sinensis]
MAFSLAPDADLVGRVRCSLSLSPSVLHGLGSSDTGFRFWIRTEFSLRQRISFNGLCIKLSGSGINWPLDSPNPPPPAPVLLQGGVICALFHNLTFIHSTVSDPHEWWTDVK